MRRVSLDLGDFVLDADSRGYTLSQKVVRKNSKTDEPYDALNLIGYFGRLDHVAERLAVAAMREGIGSGGASTTVAELHRTVLVAAARVEAALKAPHITPVDE